MFFPGATAAAKGEHLITDALSCSAAAGGLGLDDFADLTQQGWMCFFCSEERG